MNHLQVEAWTLRIIDQIKGGATLEDSRVELKAQWPDPLSASRQLAGHANAAQGTAVLWLIGVDEKRGVLGVGHVELANWYPQVQATFDGVSPEIMCDLNVPVDGKTIVALLFRTERAPYIVKNPQFGQAAAGPVELEVPWREGRKTRSARRADLVRLLEPLVLNPSLEVLGATMEAWIQRPESGGLHFLWELSLSAYVSPRLGTSIVIPFHKCQVSVSDRHNWSCESWGDFLISPPYKTSFFRDNLVSKRDSLTINSSGTEVIIQGPGKINVHAKAHVNPREGLNESVISLALKMLPLGAIIPIAIEEQLRPVRLVDREDSYGKWVSDHEQ